MPLVVAGKGGKIELACGLGITQDAEFNRFNILARGNRLGPDCLPRGDRRMTKKVAAA
jgi:hypothetical protein